MGILTLNNISITFGEFVLLENASFEVQDKDKIGLIGANGAGKSTLFKMILGKLPAEHGSISKSKFTNIGYMEQYLLTESDKIVYDEALSVFDDFMRIEHELEELNILIEKSAGIQNKLLPLIEKQHILNEQFTQSGGLTYKSRTKSTLSGLGFTENEFTQPVRTLSGGQKSKLSLAKMLLSNANLLLLDEPTNHLDIRSVEWLEDFLSSYSGAYIVISHDRYFLDKVTSKTFEIENKRLTTYNGNYSYYIEKKAQDKEINERHYNQTMQEIKRIESIIEQQRRWNREKNIKTAESKQKIVERLEATLVAPEQEVPKIKFSLTAKSGGGNEVLTVKGLYKSFADKNVLNNLSFQIKKGERVFLLGANGCGKTTLFKIILNQLLYDKGSVRLGSNIYTGYYDQSLDFSDLGKTVYDEISDTFPKLTQTEIRNALASFLFKADDVFKSIGELSGGERARVALLKLMLTGSNFLLLDEPTNHLDINSREALENALLNYGGTLFIISHDRFFINKLATKILSLENDEIKPYSGNYNDYINTDKTEIQKAVSPKEAETNDYFVKKEKEAAKRRLLSRLSKTETEISEKEKLIEELKAKQYADEYTTDYKKAMELSAEIEESEKQLDELYVLWDELSSQIEKSS